MLRSLLIGAVAGARALTPLAAVAEASRQGRLPGAGAIAGWLGRPGVRIGLEVLAAGELLGDKWRSAPDRTGPAGLAARLASGGVCGAALAPRRRAWAGFLLGAAAAAGAAYATFGARAWAMRRFGQTSTGVVEDALAVGAAALLVSIGLRGR